MRGVNAYEHVSELETRGFIMRQKSGRSFLLKPTQKFYDYFDLKGAEGAKALFKDFADLEVTVEQKQKQLEETLNHPNKRYSRMRI